MDAVTGSPTPTEGRSTRGPETDNTGLSLVEVVMALALTLLVTGSLLELVIPATALHRVLPEAAAVEQRLRYAIDLSESLADASRRALDEVERRKIAAALQDAGSHTGRAADALQISHRALVVKMQEYGIET